MTGCGGIDADYLANLREQMPRADLPYSRDLKDRLARDKFGTRSTLAIRCALGRRVVFNTAVAARRKTVVGFSGRRPQYADASCRTTPCNTDLHPSGTYHKFHSA